MLEDIGGWTHLDWDLPRAFMGLGESQSCLD